MKRLVLSFSVAWLLSVSTAGAREPVQPVPAPVAEVGPSVNPEASAFKYRQGIPDPALAVRMNAAYKGSQRRGRIETRKANGYSLSRPGANVTPFVGGGYSAEYAPSGVYDDPWLRPAPVVQPAPSLSVSQRPLKTKLR